MATDPIEGQCKLRTIAIRNNLTLPPRRWRADRSRHPSHSGQEAHRCESDRSDGSLLSTQFAFSDKLLWPASDSVHEIVSLAWGDLVNSAALNTAHRELIEDGTRIVVIPERKVGREDVAYSNTL